MCFRFEKGDKSLNVRPEAYRELTGAVFIWALRSLMCPPPPQPLHHHLLKPQKLTRLERLWISPAPCHPFQRREAFEALVTIVLHGKSPC